MFGKSKPATQTSPRPRTRIEPSFPPSQREQAEAAPLPQPEPPYAGTSSTRPSNYR